MLSHVRSSILSKVDLFILHILFSDEASRESRQYIYILKTLVQGSTFIHILKKMCMEV